MRFPSQNVLRTGVRLVDHLLSLQTMRIAHPGPSSCMVVVRLFIGIITLLFFTMSWTACRVMDRDRYVRAGNEYFNNEKYGKAEKAYRGAVEAVPNFSDGWYRLGLTHTKLGRPNDALEDFRKALKADPKNSQAPLRIAEIELYFYFSASPKFRQRLIDAEQAINKLLAASPNSWEALRLSAAIAAAKGEYKIAVAQYRRAIRINQKDMGLILSLVQVLFADGQAEEASRLADRTIEQEKTYAPLYDVLYYVYRRTNQLKEAKAVLQRKIVNNPGSCKYVIELAELYHEIHLDSEAEALVKGVISSEGPPDAVHICIGDYYYGVRRFDEALHEYIRVDTLYLMEHGRRSFYQKKLAQVLMDEGVYGDAADLLAALKAEDSNDPDVLALSAKFLALAQFHLSRGEYVKAQWILDRMLQTDPDNGVVKQMRSESMAKAGQAQQSVEQP